MTFLSKSIWKFPSSSTIQMCFLSSISWLFNRKRRYYGIMKLRPINWGCSLLEKNKKFILYLIKRKWIQQSSGRLLNFEAIKKWIKLCSDLIDFEHGELKKSETYRRNVFDFPMCLLNFKHCFCTGLKAFEVKSYCMMLMLKMRFHIPYFWKRAVLTRMWNMHKLL